MSFYTELIAAGLNVTSATESGEVTGTFASSDFGTLSDVILSYFHPEEWAEVQATRAAAQQLRDTYAAMITRLGNIQTGNPPFTSAGFSQVVQAVKDEALYIERLCRFLKGIFYNPTP